MTGVVPTILCQLREPAGVSKVEVRGTVTRVTCDQLMPEDAECPLPSFDYHEAIVQEVCLPGHNIPPVLLTMKPRSVDR